MAPTHAASREAFPATTQGVPSRTTTESNNQAPLSRLANSKGGIPSRPSRIATDDEILGIDLAPRTNPRDPELSFDSETGSENNAEEGAADGSVTGLTARDRADTTNEPEDMREIFDANPELRRAWQDAQSYREAFATPEDARAASAVLANMNRMDALFFSRRPEDHAELARVVASLDPAAFTSLAQAMAAHAASAGSGRRGSASSSTGAASGVDAMQGGADPARSSPSNGVGVVGAQHAAPAAARALLSQQQPVPDGVFQPNGETAPSSIAGRSSATPLQTQASANPPGPTQAQTEFFHATNAAAVESVLDAIETQVERRLPEGVPKSARNRVVGEIYRELDTTLRSNRQLGQQMRDAFRSGALDADHQRALVSLVTGRARQALPAVAKRVLSEWRSTIVAANQDRRSRQRAAERRVDIAGSRGGSTEGQRSMTPREIDCARMSDADILNL